MECLKHQVFVGTASQSIQCTAHTHKLSNRATELPGKAHKNTHTLIKPCQMFRLFLFLSIITTTATYSIFIYTLHSSNDRSRKEKNEHKLKKSERKQEHTHSRSIFKWFFMCTQVATSLTLNNTSCAFITMTA